MSKPIDTRAAGSAAKDAPTAKQLPPARYVHLKVHSAYSLLEGALPISKLAILAQAGGMPAIGLTDTNNMFGVIEFADKIAKDGIQPIAGISIELISKRPPARTASPWRRSAACPNQNATA